MKGEKPGGIPEEVAAQKVGKLETGAHHSFVWGQSLVAPAVELTAGEQVGIQEAAENIIFHRS